MTEIICAIIAGIASVITASVGVAVSRANKRSEHRAERHAELRQRENLLSLRMMDATLQLSVVCSNALTGGHNNGNVERARGAAQKVAADYENFMRETTAHEVSK
mgnify:CR=1 FL=1